MNLALAYFIIIFAVLGKSLWFVYYFSLYAYQENKRPRFFKGKAALIVPVYNEDEDKLTRTLKQAKKADWLYKIIFVNDGSTNNVFKVLKANSEGIEIVNLKKNQGKRRAQYAGIKKAKDADVFVFMDSDTLLRKKSIVQLTKWMTKQEIGGATAQILVKNRKKNFLTRCLSSMYWSASNIWRKAPSNIGIQQVTNGQLSCYRAELVRKLMPEYIQQKFLGNYCTISDDRYLTHHIQTDFKKRLVYAETSLAYTYVPETFRGAYKMFKRWKLGSLRESILLLSRFKKAPILTLDVWLNHAVTFLQTIMRLIVIGLGIFYPIIFLYYLLITVIISLLFAFHMIIQNTKEVIFKVLYSFLNEIYFGWVFIDALIHIREQGKWGTR